MIGSPEIRSMLVGLLCACAGCISAPPGSADRADAGDASDHSSLPDTGRPSDGDGGSDGFDAHSDSDGAMPDGGAVPDAASDTGSDALDEPDAGPSPYAPLPVRRIAMVLNPMHEVGVTATTEALLLHLKVGLNAELTFGSPNTLSTGDEDLLWFPHESGQHFAESTFVVLAGIPRPIVATRTAAWPPLDFAHGLEEILYVTQVQVVDPRPAAAQFVETGPLQIYRTERGASSRPVLGNGVTEVALNESGEPTVFTYEQNAQMAPDPAGTTTPTAPARRVGFAPDSYLDFTAGGWDLLDGAVLWALSESLTPTLDCHILTEQTAAQATMMLRSRMRLHGCDVQVLDSPGADLTNSDLVIVLPDAAARDTVGTALAGLASPVLVLWNRSDALETMGLTDANPVEHGAITDSWVIRDDIDERLQTARTGHVQLSTSVTTFPALRLNDAVDMSSLIVAHAAVDNTLVTYWAYDKGMQMYGRIAPARRVAMASPEAAAPKREALELLDGSIQWLLDR